jgi:hypothetical protein
MWKREVEESTRSGGVGEKSSESTDLSRHLGSISSTLQIVISTAFVRMLQRLHGLFCLHHQSFCSSNQERALSNLRPNTAPECHAGLAIFRSNCARITTPSTDSGSSYLDPPRYGMSVGGY